MGQSCGDRRIRAGAGPAEAAVPEPFIAAPRARAANDLTTAGPEMLNCIHLAARGADTSLSGGAANHAAGRTRGGAVARQQEITRAHTPSLDSAVGTGESQSSRENWTHGWQA